MLNLDKDALLLRRRKIEGQAKNLALLCVDATPHIKAAFDPFTEYWGEVDVECRIGEKPKAMLVTSFKHKTCWGNRVAFHATITLEAERRAYIDYYTMTSGLHGTHARHAITGDLTGRNIADAYLSALKPRIEAAFEAVVLGEEHLLRHILID